jgi:hypothetical protein
MSLNAEESEPGDRRYVVRRGTLSPAVVASWIHCIVVVLVLLGTSAGRFALLYLFVILYVIGVLVIVSLTILNAWVITKKEVLGYITWAATLALELLIVRRYLHHSHLEPWATAGEVCLGAMLALCLGEILWLAIVGRVHVIDDS